MCDLLFCHLLSPKQATKETDSDWVQCGSPPQFAIALDAARTDPRHGSNGWGKANNHLCVQAVGRRNRKREKMANYHLEA